MTKHDLGQIQGGVTFMVPGKPVGKGRPRATRQGKGIKLYTPEKTATYESTVAIVAMQAMAGRPLLTGPVDVVMMMVLLIPVSWSNRKKEHALDGIVMPTTKPDMDNVVKAIFDASNGVVWNDDTQVVNLQVRKRYGLVPGVHVMIHSVEACGS